MCVCVCVSVCMCTHAYTHSTNKTFKISSLVALLFILSAQKINMIVCHLNQRNSSSLRSRYQRERERNVSCYFCYFLYTPCQICIQQNMFGNLSMPYSNRVNQMHTIHWQRVGEFITVEATNRSVILSSPQFVLQMYSEHSCSSISIFNFNPMNKSHKRVAGPVCSDEIFGVCLKLCWELAVANYPKRQWRSLNLFHGARSITRLLISQTMRVHSSSRAHVDAVNNAVVGFRDSEKEETRYCNEKQQYSYFQRWVRVTSVCYWGPQKRG